MSRIIVMSATAFVTALWLTPAANAVTLFWDADSTLEGTGTWDVNTTQNWSTSNVAGAPDAKWNPNDGTARCSVRRHARRKPARRWDGFNEWQE